MAGRALNLAGPIGGDDRLELAGRARRSPVARAPAAPGVVEPDPWHERVAFDEMPFSRTRPGRRRHREQPAEGNARGRFSGTTGSTATGHGDTRALQARDDWDVEGSFGCNSTSLTPGLEIASASGRARERSAERFATFGRAGREPGAGSPAARARAFWAGCLRARARGYAASRLGRRHGFHILARAALRRRAHGEAPGLGSGSLPRSRRSAGDVRRQRRLGEDTAPGLGRARPSPAGIPRPQAAARTDLRHRPLPIGGGRRPWPRRPYPDRTLAHIVIPSLRAVIEVGNWEASASVAGASRGTRSRAYDDLGALLLATASRAWAERPAGGDRATLRQAAPGRATVGGA